MEMIIICSNLARGCEKQYVPKESENFRKLAEFFRSGAEPAVASEQPDRGALRCQVWAEN